MTHPILAAAASFGEALNAVADTSPTFMSVDDKAAALQELARVETRVAELRLRILAEADDLAATTGARDAADWYAEATRTRHEDARADLRLATALDRRWHALGAAVGEGRVSTAQARVIDRALDELPAEVPAEVVDRAEACLIEHACRFAPRQLARVGHHILAVVAPDLVDEAEGKRLAELDADAGDGTASDPVARLSYPRRLGEAFCQLLETLDPKRLPVHGGDATTMIVTVPLETLTAGLGVAHVLGVGTVPSDPQVDPCAGETISAGQARRLACNAHLGRGPPLGQVDRRRWDRPRQRCAAVRPPPSPGTRSGVHPRADARR